MKDFDKYSVFVVWSAEDETFISTVPELPGCLSDGDTVELAIANLRTVAREWIDTAKEEGRTIPEPMDMEKMEAAQLEALQSVKVRVEQEVREAVTRTLQMMAKSRSLTGIQSPGSRILWPEYSESEKTPS